MAVLAVGRVAAAAAAFVCSPLFYVLTASVLVLLIWVFINMMHSDEPRLDQESDIGSVVSAVRKFRTRRNRAQLQFLSMIAGWISMGGLSKKKKRKKLSILIRRRYLLRNTIGQYATQFRLLKNEREEFYGYLRMSPERFNHLMTMLRPHLPDKLKRGRGKPIPKEMAVVICLRYLATGDSQRSQSFNFCVSRSAISRLVREVCLAIWVALQPTYLSRPNCPEEWRSIAEGFFDEWDYPNALGAVDGKHIEVECPANQGSNFFNYLKYHSTILMAVCDAHYRFTYVDIGSYGHENDAAVFSRTTLYSDFENGKAGTPFPRDVEGMRMPYALLGDEIFGLKHWLMKPFPADSLSEEKRVYNYRHSRARRTIENSFGILRARWRIFRAPIKAEIDLIDQIVKACVCLHNYLLFTENARYVPTGFVDSYNSSGDLTSGTWREAVRNDGTPGLRDLAVTQGSHNFSYDAKVTRENFCRYFNSNEGSVPWQLSHVRKTK